MTTLSVQELLSFGWNTFKKRPWFFVGTILIYMVVQMALGFITGPDAPGIAVIALSFVVSTLLNLGLMSVYLKAHDTPEAPSYKDLWAPAHFWRYLAVSILIAIVVLVGLVLLIIPGIFAALALSMAGYLVIDRNMGPIEAMKESYRITKGNWLKLFLFGLCMLVLGILGAIPFGIGLLVVAPITMLATVHAYRKLSHGVAEVASTAPAPAPTPAS